MKVWDRAGIKLATPGSAVRVASVARHVTDSAMGPGNILFYFILSSEINAYQKQIKVLSITSEMI